MYCCSLASVSATQCLFQQRGGAGEFVEVVGLTDADHLVSQITPVDFGDLHGLCCDLRCLFVGEEVVAQAIEDRLRAITDIPPVAVTRSPFMTAMILSSASLRSIMRRPPIGSACTRMLPSRIGFR